MSNKANNLNAGSSHTLPRDNEGGSDSLEANIKLENQLAMWREEQHQIASKVIILPNINDDSYSYLHQYKIISEDHPSCRSYQNELFGGVDVSFPSSQKPNNPAVAVYVIVRGDQIVYQSHVFFMPSVPYVSSYLSFREIDPLEKLVRKQLKERPELTPKAILVDGNGIMHVRRSGIACFLGVRTGIPTIGVAKSLYCYNGITVSLVDHGIENRVRDVYTLFTSNEKTNSNLATKCSLIIDDRPIEALKYEEEEEAYNISNYDVGMPKMIEHISKETNAFSVEIRGNAGSIWGAIIIGHGGGILPHKKKKQSGTKNPIFVSVGHNISLHEALHICANLSITRIPEPVRRADLLGRDFIRKYT